MMTLFAIGTNVGAPKRPLAFNRAAPSASERVAGQLRDEEDEQVCRDCAFGWRVTEDGEPVDDEWGGGEEDDRCCREHDERDGHDRRYRFPSVVLVAGREARHEDRYERRRQDPAEHEVLDDVGDRVREVVGVGGRAARQSRCRARTRERRSGRPQ